MSDVERTLHDNSLVSKAQDSDSHNAKSQLSIAKMFAWVTLAALMFASFNGVLQSSGFLGTLKAVSPRNVIMVYLTWTLFLVHHVHEKSRTAILVHVVPPAAILFFLLIFRISFTESMAIMLSTNLLSNALSMILGTTTIVSAAIRNNTNPFRYLAYQVFGGIIFFTLVVSFVPSLMRRSFDFPSATMGAIIGFWLGLYQGMATSKRIQNVRILGVGLRPIATAGMLGSWAGPMMLATANKYIMGIPYLPFQYGPFFGFVAAIVVVGIYRAFGWHDSKFNL